MNNCSVVMISYFTGPVLFASVKSVLRQQQLAELVVVNNGNPPDVIARLQQMALGEPRLKILSGGGNVGYAKACNAGAAKATGEFLLLLNPDCLLPPDALIGIMKGFSDIPGAVVAGCHMVNPDGSEQQGDRQRLLAPRYAVPELVTLHRLLRRRRPDALDMPMQLATHEVPAVSGACMCLKRADYEQLGGLDEQFFLHVEDMDLCMRVHKMRGRVICVPRVRVTHMPGAHAKVSKRFIEWHRAKGTVYYFRKHFREVMMPGMMPLLTFLVLAHFTVASLLDGARKRIAPVSHMSQSVAAKRLMILASGLAELPEKKDWHGKTILVTGATGQVGLCVLKRLIAQGAAVLAISRADAIPFEHEHLRWIKGDLTDSSLHLQGYLIDMAVHCAPLWHLPQTIDLLADAEVKRIVAFGSTSVFGKVLSRNRHEKEMVAKLSKAESDIATRCNAKNIQWTIFRPTMTYGVGLDLNITSLAKLIDRFSFMPVYPPAFGRRQPVHADDLAIAVIQAAGTTTSIGRSYNLSGGDVLTYREMLEKLFAVCHKKPRIIETTLLPFLLSVAGKILRKKHINGEIARRMNDDLVFFHDEAARDFAFNPRPFLSGGIKDIEGV